MYQSNLQKKKKKKKSLKNDMFVLQSNPCRKSKVFLFQQRLYKIQDVLFEEQ
ncbi:hypothetical protein HanRHA438_Chr17g0794991 [Helianthus annuus]|nr:hypothetical protein HanRHA438_Chr17g0794991 [Helianthus annuus]